MTNLHAEDLTIEVLTQPDRLELFWLGTSTNRNPASFLLPWFEQVFELALERGLAVDMHFERLEHFNSSSISALVQLMNMARERGVSLKLRYDGTLRWQALSFDALKSAMRPFAQKEGPVVEFDPDARAPA